MKNKILLLIVLGLALCVSLTVNTLSYYSSVSSFGAQIVPDTVKIQQQ